MAARYLRVPIQGDLVGLEVNTILRRHLHLSGTVLRRIKWLSDGITVDGQRVTVRYRVQAGELLAVRLTDPAPTSGTVPTPGPLDLIGEDEDVVVVNKPPGLLVHPSHGHFADTLGNFHSCTTTSKPSRTATSTPSTDWTRALRGCWWWLSTHTPKSN